MCGTAPASFALLKERPPNPTFPALSHHLADSSPPCFPTDMRMRILPGSLLALLVLLSGLGVREFAHGEESTGGAFSAERVVEHADGTATYVHAVLAEGADAEAALDQLLPREGEPVATAAFMIWRKWKADELPLPFRVNPANSPPGLNLTLAAQFAADTWSVATGQRFHFRWEGATTETTTTDPTSCSGFTDHGFVTLAWKANGLNPAILAFTCIDFANTELVDGVARVSAATITFNSSYTWSDLPVTPADSYDLWSNALHEMGHVLGLFHSTAQGSVMSTSLTKGLQRRSLTDDDLAGIRSLYGNGGSTVITLPSALPRRAFVALAAQD